MGLRSLAALMAIGAMFLPAASVGSAFGIGGTAPALSQSLPWTLVFPALAVLALFGGGTAFAKPLDILSAVAGAAVSIQVISSFLEADRQLGAASMRLDGLGSGAPMFSVQPGPGSVLIIIATAAAILCVLLPTGRPRAARR